VDFPEGFAIFWAIPESISDFGHAFAFILSSSGMPMRRRARG
jgi:hypothetical protein